jgi:hypothetical protein
VKEDITVAFRILTHHPQAGVRALATFLEEEYLQLLTQGDINKEVDKPVTGRTEAL